ncbi:MAG: hypothetical protein HYZ34_11580 [Ignavibacteriae bacterium]|nr:hypothetical protein [Ignavibacteriota bacterium]
MNSGTIQGKGKAFSSANGKPIEVTIPFNVFQELLELKLSMEIYKRKNVQKGIKQSKKEVQNGKARSFTDIDEAIEWLKK